MTPPLPPLENFDAESRNAEKDADKSHNFSQCPTIALESGSPAHTGTCLAQS